MAMGVQWDDKTVDEWHDKGPWKGDMQYTGSHWRIVNADTGKTKKMGPVGAVRSNYFDAAKREAARRNHAHHKQRFLTNPKPFQSQTPVADEIARQSRHAQELADTHKRSYILTTEAISPTRRVVHIRAGDQFSMGRNEKIIATFHPDVKAVPDCWRMWNANYVECQECSHEADCKNAQIRLRKEREEPVVDEDDEVLPNLHPDDFDRWMKIAGLTWYLVRQHGVRVESIEPKARPFEDRVPVTVYVDKRSMVIAVRWRKRASEGGEWNEFPVPWKLLVPEIVNALGSLYFDDHGTAYQRFRGEATQQAWDWLLDSGYLTPEAVEEARK